LLILGLLEGGTAWAWNAPQSVGTLVGGGALLVAFVAVELRAPEPVLPMWVFSRRLLGATALVGVGVGVGLISMTTYIPTYLETLTGVSPIVSGLALAALTLGWPLSSAQSGRVYLRIGFRATILIGGAVVVAAQVALAVTSTTPSVAVVAACCFVMGLGFGFVGAPSMIAAQSSVGWGERGVVTGANMFARSIGSAVGVAALGALVNAIMRGADAVAEPERFRGAATAVFVATVGVTLLMLVAAAAMPRVVHEVHDDERPDDERLGRAVHDDA
jgi:MFS family permease